MEATSIDVKNILKVCNRDEALFAPVICLLTRPWDIDVIIADGENFYIYDKLANCYNLYAHQVQARKEIMNMITERPLRIRIFDINSFKELKNKFEYEYQEICRVCSTKEPIEYKENYLKLRLATPNDIDSLVQTAKDTWNGDTGYFSYGVENERLWIGQCDYDDSSFIAGGFHIDDSIGFLFVDKEHRRRGFGAEMARFLFNYVFNYKVPIAFCETYTTNVAELNMLEGIGCKISEQPIYWLFSYGF